jgi:hypothetical protein
LPSEKIIVDQNASIIDVDIPGLGKFKTNYPSALVPVIGVLLVFFPTYQWPHTSEKFRVSGKISLDGKPSEGIMVAIIPGSQKILTHSDGT